jgi:TonB family protein
MHLILALLLLLQGSGGSDDQIRERLTGKYVGKLFTVKTFPTGNRLRFDSDGKLIGPVVAGMFTLDGHIHVDSVNVRADRIEFAGKRSFLSYNTKSGKLEEYPTKESLRVEFARKPGVAAESAIEGTLISLDDAIKSLPPYWARLLTGAPILETITDPETGETIPRASEAQKLTPNPTRRLPPAYPVSLNDYEIAGSVVVRVTVDESGKPTVVDIVTPMGFGLDQSAINAVSRWQYEPAKRDGKPVKVYVRVQFNFSPPR